VGSSSMCSSPTGSCSTPSDLAPPPDLVSAGGGRGGGGAVGGADDRKRVRRAGRSGPPGALRGRRSTDLWPLPQPPDLAPREEVGAERRCGTGVVWTSLGPLPRWVPGPTTRWAPGTTRLALHGTCWREAQGLRRRSTRIGSYTCPTLYRGLLDVLD
jgi:hypothetical protein